ncbi:gap junction alpha-3 protein-like [Symphalangus syndactylus]|uniref:gap junction alpha-3 protein-like n=1 Tax=Symphalangus syndactylus TaxID=9590 RepID=UPI003005B078
MSDVSLPWRSPRSRVSSLRTSGGNRTSSGGGGGSHLKPPTLGSSSKNETPIRLAPREDIDDSPPSPPGRAIPGSRERVARWLSPGRSAASCPRSPPRSPGHGRRVAAALRGRSSPASGGRGRSRHSRHTEKERQGLLPETASRRQPPPTLPVPQVRAQPAASQPGSGRASRAPRGRAGPGGLGRGGSPRTLHVARARFLLLCYFPGLPRTPSRPASIARN